MVGLETLEGIRNKIHSRNWGLYVSNDNENIDSIVPRGPVSSLIFEIDHIVLPGSSRKTIEEMKDSLFNIKREKNYPILKNGLVEFALVLVKFREDHVHVRDLHDHYIKYSAFERYLDSLPRCLF